MALQDTIEDLEAKRDKITQALHALYALDDETPTTPQYRSNPSPYNRTPTRNIATPAPTKKTRATDPDRSAKMKEAWAKRRAAASQPSPQFIAQPPAPPAPPAENDYAAQLARAVEAVEEPPTSVVEDIPIEPLPVEVTQPLMEPTSSKKKGKERVN